MKLLGHGTRDWVWLAVVVFVLNLVWENAHGALYDHVIPGWGYLRAAAGDVILVLLPVALTRPLRRVRMPYSACVAVVLVVVGVAVEALALAEGRWAYTTAMPTLAGIGISPLLQLPATGLVALLIVRRTCPRARHRDKTPPSERRLQTA